MLARYMCVMIMGGGGGCDVASLEEVRVCEFALVLGDE